jgi:hypothetical protein
MGQAASYGACRTPVAPGMGLVTIRNIGPCKENGASNNFWCTTPYKIAHIGGEITPAKRVQLLWYETTYLYAGRLW